jgi:uncharacterized protein (TIGR03437 family)
MRFLTVSVVLALAALPHGWAQSSPNISTISNSASGSLAPLPNSTIAQGSFFSIFGSGLGPADSTCSANPEACLWHPYPLPPALNGTSVKVTVGATSLPAYVEYASDTQINAVMPSNISEGEGSIQVTYNGQTSTAAPVTVSADSFGTFSADQTGTGPGVTFNIDPVTHAPSLNTLLSPAEAGQYVTMYGTGLGAPIDVKDEQSAAPVFPDDFTQPPHNMSVQVWVGGQQATVSYAGSSQYSAEDQINFVVPAGITGCYVPVAIYAGPQGGKQTVSNFTTMSISTAGSACSDANGLNAADLAGTLQTNGSASIGVVQLTSNHLDIGGTLNIVSDNAAAAFASFPTHAVEISLGLAQAPSVNTCIVTQFTGLNPAASDPVLNPQYDLINFLNAGSSLTVSGPNGSQQVPELSTGLFFGTIGGASLTDPFAGSLFPPFFLNKSTLTFVPGTYTVTLGGGTQVGGFSSSVDIGTPITWTNQSALTQIPQSRTEGLNITWSGGQSGSFVVITGIGYTSANGAIPTSSDAGAEFTCVAPASAGEFTVPSVVLQALPSTAQSSTVPLGYLLLGNSGPPQQISPVPAGLNAAYLFYRILSGVNIVWE